MMRFGFARLAAGLAGSDRPTATTALTSRLAKLLTTKRQLPEDSVEAFARYLAGKPGSPRYSPLRKALAVGDRPAVERQDLWLADPALGSQVGALSENYYGDPVSLATLLGLLQERTNIVLSRGRLSALSAKEAEEGSPASVDLRQALFLGLWLLDADGDWLWAFLRVLHESDQRVVTVENRVDLLLATFDALLQARHLSSGATAYLSARRRLLELHKITTRNKAEGLNLGQPWSWFLVPRLELLVDARILAKDQPHDLTGYRLSTAGQGLQRLAVEGQCGVDLLQGYFAAHRGIMRSQAEIPWADLHPALQQALGQFHSATGYYPVYESAAAVCVERAARAGRLLPWEVPDVAATVRAKGTGENAPLVLGIDKFGNVYNFKFKR